MNNVPLRYPHLMEQILQKLDNESLVKSRKVGRMWQKFIDQTKFYPWIHIVKIPTILKDGNTYLHVAAKTGQAKFFNLILENEDIIDSNNNENVTPFQLACERGHSNIIKVLIEKFDPIKMNFNKKDNHGQTGFHVACKNGHSKTVDMLILESTKLKLNLSAKDWITALHFYNDRKIRH